MHALFVRYDGDSVCTVQEQQQHIVRVKEQDHERDPGLKKGREESSLSTKSFEEYKNPWLGSYKTGLTMNAWSALPGSFFTSCYVDAFPSGPKYDDAFPDNTCTMTQTQSVDRLTMPYLVDHE